MSELAHGWHSSAAGSDPWDTSGKTFEYHKKGAGEAYRSVGKMILPWYKRWDLYDSDKLTKAIEEFYAQERDPEFVRKRNELKKDMRDGIENDLSGVKAIRAGRLALQKYYDEQRKKGKTRGRKRT